MRLDIGASGRLLMFGEGFFGGCPAAAGTCIFVSKEFMEMQPGEVTFLAIPFLLLRFCDSLQLEPMYPQKGGFYT